MARAKDLLLSGLVLVVSRGRRKPRKSALRTVPDYGPNPGAETAAIVLLFLSALCGAAFVGVYAVDRIPDQTQYLGLSMGLCCGFLAAALIVTALKLVVTEEIAEEYPPNEHPHEQALIAEVVEESASRLTRARLFKLGLAAAGGGLTAAALTPAVSFGPFLRIKYFFGTPWRAGRRLVDENGRPWKASDIEEKNFYTAFPEDDPDLEAIGAPLVVIRLPKSALRLPPEVHGYDADGILAFSKICTHAGCAISLYRAPLFEATDPHPALVCPCHYSTFDPSTGGQVIFGPAPRPLPMLPLMIDRKGYLRARGNFDAALGPSWWGVRNRKPSS
ncbi:MAG TPA: Rieske (2Fe-2S) protein [Gaiellaceae bacterium]|nr:Rieske (2Fe-2S) protein [Gaiellaceae bacterium]